jgi:hypothetical protein
VVLGARGVRYLDEERLEGEDPLAPFSASAARHLARTDGFAHVADIMVGSFYDPALDEGCAFEELISFHGGLGGPQTRAFVLAPAALPPPDGPIGSGPKRSMGSCAAGARRCSCRRGARPPAGTA